MIQAEKILIAASLKVDRHVINSGFLQRDVMIDIYCPFLLPASEKVNLLLINDGQDLPQMDFSALLENMNACQQLEPLVCVGIYCGEERRLEYGTINEPDYKGRGIKAGLYSKFVLKELMPFLYAVLGGSTFKQKAFAGFSLGGLSALDLVWNYPDQFSMAAVFSGALWWRSKGYQDGYCDERDRIMHQRIKNKSFDSRLKFFFQCGLLDETADRNNNGIIDSVEDTQDIISELKKKGYPDSAIKYLEMPDGRHDISTWAKAFPSFLHWAWGHDATR